MKTYESLQETIVELIAENKRLKDEANYWRKRSLHLLTPGEMKWHSEGTK